MEMNREMIIELEGLAKLDLPENERDKILEDFIYLTNQFKKISEVDTTEVKPLVHVTSLTNVLREDITIKTIPREEILKNAPEQNDGYFQVPQTLE